MEQASRDPALDRLDVLVGDWEVEATPPGGPPWPGSAQSSFEWLEGRRFLIERSTVDMPEAPDGIQIYGLGDEPDAFRVWYFDSRGVHRIYEMTLADGVWRMWRDSTDPFPQRFEAEVADDGETITGRYEKAPDGSTWEVDFDIIYRRVG
jgi:hypothetical protein